MSRNYDNWERLVAAVIKREEIWLLCHQASRSPSICSEASSSDFSSNFRLSDANLEEMEESAQNPIPKLDLINADAAITFAVGKLRVTLNHKVNFLKGVEDQVGWLKDELQMTQCFLKDAVEMQGNNELIRKLIGDVREVAQDAEDAIEIFTLKVDAPRKMTDLLRKWAGFPAHVSHLNRVGKDIESIRTRLDEIAKRWKRYGIGNLVDQEGNEESEMVEVGRRMAAHNQKDNDVVGLNRDVDFLINNVILNEQRKGLSLAAIVGMGGIGKTTLATKIFNHPDVAAGFEKRAMVVVSREFAAEDIMKQIMHTMSVPLDAEELNTLESFQDRLRRQEMLQDILRKRLEGKRYFIVLDDVWKHKHWEVLKIAFPDEQDKASRVMFTSRNQIITENLGHVHKMELLKSDDSWELFLMTTSRGWGERFICPQELWGIGRKILEKCHRLPLAITVAGGLLKSQDESKSGWDRVLKQIENYHSETSEIGKSVTPILELSYHNLPSHLKPCFLCLAFFEEGVVIKAKRLMHIWVALGLVQDGEESAEETARSYLDELINRNFVCLQNMAIYDKVRLCRVHDLLHELSIKKAKEEIGFERLVYNEDDQGSSSSSAAASSSKPRHRVVRGIEKRSIQIDTSNQNKHIRSLFLRVEGPNTNAYYSTSSYWKGFELLRILDIEGSRLQKLPSTIRSLIEIRYLRLKEEGELRLPSWLDALKNLEILDITDCKSVTFPNVTWKMDSLRHLCIDCPCSDFSDSMKKSSWPNLETLKYMRSDVVLFPIQGAGRRLRKLGIQVMGSEDGAEMRRLLVESTVVQVLHLRWNHEWQDKELPIPNSLDRLTKLKLDGRLDRCPSADKFPQSITHLVLSKSHITGNDLLQELGKLPNLSGLKLVEALSTQTTIKISCGGFPKLKVLHLSRILQLENIVIEKDGMPQLQRIETHTLPKHISIINYNWQHN
ncbi:hypothetical protein ACS0TY_005028 [Phlomoides rotata]